MADAATAAAASASARDDADGEGRALRSALLSRETELKNVTAELIAATQRLHELTEAEQRASADAAGAKEQLAAAAARDAERERAASRAIDRARAEMRAEVEVQRSRGEEAVEEIRAISAQASATQRLARGIERRDRPEIGARSARGIEPSDAEYRAVVTRR